MKRRGPIEPVGLSALDLICGLFGLLVVLYAITDRVDGSPGVTSADLNFVRAQVEHGEAIFVGLELKVGALNLRSWPNCADSGPVRWGRCQPGLTEGLVESDDNLTTVGIVLLRRDGGGIIGAAPKTALLTTKERTFLCTLEFGKGFRARVDVTAAGGNAQCAEV